jgi:hypothetical protein
MPGSCRRLEAGGLSLTQTTPLRIHASVDTFVAATGQVVETLRAWSTSDSIDLLTPESWQSQSAEAIERRVAHELCHVALFQRTKEGRPPPRALAEGFCSVVAGQQDERLPLDDVLREAGNDSPIDFSSDTAFAYGVSHHVVASFVRCRGSAAFLMAIDRIAAGVDVTTALGAPPRAFLSGCPSP